MVDQTKIRYLEIVSNDVSGQVAIFEAALGMSFSAPIAELGEARVALMAAGGQIGVRAPMHDAEAPVTRPYYATDDIEQATQKAIEAGAELAHPVLEIPGQGRFSILFHGGNQFGFWQD